ncbi:MAG: hypothetical protein RBS80_25375, partial [Thermoguttaceae bacterium]|nr:hypothetical protein [Thermoguttaceae bacterium]
MRYQKNFGRACRVAALLLALAGCRSLDFYDPAAEAPVPAPLIPPREKNMMSLPAYRVEPPDLLQIEVLKLVP